MRYALVPSSCISCSVRFSSIPRGNTDTHQFLKKGVSAFIGLAVTCLFLPMNHYAGKVVVVAQENLMKARDERVALMNEVLGAIRMLKVCRYSVTQSVLY